MFLNKRSRILFRQWGRVELSLAVFRDIWIGIECQVTLCKKRVEDLDG